MNLLKRRQLKKLEKLNATNKAVTQNKTESKAPTKSVSKFRQRLQLEKKANPTDQLNELEDQVEGVKDDLAEGLETQAGEISEVSEKLEKSHGELADDLGSVQNDVGELENQVEGVKDDLAEGLESQAGELSEVSEKLDKSLGELSDDLDSVQCDVSDLENRADGHDDDIQELKSKFDEGESKGNPELETHKAIVEQCLETIRSIDDIDERKPYKAEACKRIEPFVSGYVESKAKYPNSVAIWFMIWLFDLEDIDKAVPLALHLIAQNIHKMPMRFKSSGQTFICDEVYKWAAKQLEQHKSAGPYLGDVIKVLEADKWKLPVLVNGMMYMMRAKHFEAMGEDKAALADYEKAMSINSRAGAAKIIPKLKAKLGLE